MFSPNRTGYLHPLYAQSMSEYGHPLELPSSQGWILKRSIPGTAQFDGMGCYPIFMCEDWSKLGKDLSWLEGQLVALSLVTDPFGEYTRQDLSQYFKDVAKPYKQHFIVDLHRRPNEFVAAHHQRNARKALKTIKVEISREPIYYLDEWDLLYENLIRRHGITGITRFSHSSFEKQLRVPGIIAFRAVAADETVGMLLWYVQGKIGYYHLGAYSPAGYELNASFALFWGLLEYFSDMGLRWLSLGAGAGVNAAEQDGLTRFKRGWATGTRTAFFCGRIFDSQKYDQILSMRNLGNTDYFPAYRAGEFG